MTPLTDQLLPLLESASGWMTSLELHKAHVAAGGSASLADVRKAISRLMVNRKIQVRDRVLPNGSRTAEYRAKGVA